MGYVENPIIQEFVQGIEYTVDAFSDFDGNIVSVVPRERIDVVDGESYKSRTVHDKEIIENSRKLIEKLGTIGHVTIQCIKRGVGLKFVEVNPRFGGACALSIAAGVNTPLFLLYLIAGKGIDKKMTEFREGVVMLRYTDDIYINPKTKKFEKVFS
jgi:carbamoyl-phosphate synthase large subunit